MATKTQKVILRSPDAGVFYGEILEKDDALRTVTLKNARQIWSWEGAATLMQLAKYGSSKPDSCKITVQVDSIGIYNVSEIIPCTKEAMINLDSITEWRE